MTRNCRKMTKQDKIRKQWIKIYPIDVEICRKYCKILEIIESLKILKRNDKNSKTTVSNQNVVKMTKIVKMLKKRRNVVKCRKKRKFLQINVQNVKKKPTKSGLQNGDNL